MVYELKFFAPSKSPKNPPKFQTETELKFWKKLNQTDNFSPLLFGFDSSNQWIFFLKLSCFRNVHIIASRRHSNRLFASCSSIHKINPSSYGPEKKNQSQNMPTNWSPDQSITPIYLISGIWKNVRSYQLIHWNKP